MSKKPDFDVGLATGVQYWLVFMLGLAVLGYSPLLSITFGAIGGVASGIIAAWLKPKASYVPTKAEKQTKEEEEGKEVTTVVEPKRRSRFRKYGTPVARRQHQSRGRRHFGWLFRRKV
ncbi:hypothetical protein [Stenomitos frigidus]|uniref:Uncharacterized protein n=1 Tax=Stenomitos frigidus ULC18 TaxID=2107698 RepID=A0A2T1DZY1_9CYAN|nr:hypothetical protein [Stenomitos frigidus]PSB26019.1 hypothetical protein C7B82_21205 [Stenomitos frigidus ULC18]